MFHTDAAPVPVHLTRACSSHAPASTSGGLFERAAMESGPVADWSAKPMYSAQDSFNVVAKNLGCSDKGSPAAVLACMRVRGAAGMRCAGASRQVQ